MKKPATIDKAEPQASVPPSGLCCPKCECEHVPVLYTRPRPPRRIQRRRECRHCGHRFTTWESVS